MASGLFPFMPSRISLLPIVAAWPAGRTLVPDNRNFASTSVIVWIWLLWVIVIDK